MNTDGPVVFTVGHSTRTQEEFLALLEAHGVRSIIDVRTIPKSLRNPQFGGEQLARFLSGNGMNYTHVPEVGGLRSPFPDSKNDGWKNRSFRGYADHMGTEEFARGLARVMEIAKERPAAVMCAEAVPWRCHRSLLSDALVEAGWTVRHIMSESKSESHRPTPFLRVRKGKMTYPKDGSQELPLG